MHRTTDVTSHKALAVLRSFTADMREWGVTVSSEEKLMALARAYFADSRNTLDGLLLYIAWYGSGEGVVFERDRHDEVFGLMTVTFFSHLVTGWGSCALFLRLTPRPGDGGIMLRVSCAGGLRWDEKKTKSTRRAGTPWRKRWSLRGFTAGRRDAGWTCWTGAVTVRNGPGWRPAAVSVWKMPENLNRQQNILRMYTGWRPIRRNEWVSMHRTGSEGIPLTENPVKNRHADHRGAAAR